MARVWGGLDAGVQSAAENEVMSVERLRLPASGWHVLQGYEHVGEPRRSLRPQLMEKVAPILELRKTFGLYRVLF